MPHTKKHRTALYTLVAVLAIIQIGTLVVVGLQISKLNLKIDAGLQSVEEEANEHTENLVSTYDSLYQENFREISGIISEQQKNFEQKISLLQSSQEDFSGIAEQSVKGVVTISTDKSIGSGFIINSGGYVVTNYHVIRGRETNVFVVTQERESLPAAFVGKDELRDLALLKIDGEHEALQLAKNDSVQVGQKVIAIGNPLGLSFTVTEGIISALDRAGPSGFNEYIQTDVSLNPGNSGGPLIDKQGKVVGINNFKIGGAESLGFALESDAIKQSVNAIMNYTLIP